MLAPIAPRLRYSTAFYSRLLAVDFSLPIRGCFFPGLFYPQRDFSMSQQIEEALYRVFSLTF
jgi:hypothetical protein